jgi:hypothetical protein
MRKFHFYLSCLTISILLNSCIGGYRIDPERVRRENPQVYKEWVANLRKKSVTDERLREIGFKDPLQPAESNEQVKPNQ